MSKLCWLSAVLFFIPAVGAQGQIAGRPVVVVNNFHASAPSAHFSQPTVNTNSPLVIHVPALNANQTTSVANAAASRSLYYSSLRDSALNSALPPPKRAVSTTRPSNHRLPLGTTVETANQAAANGYTVQEVRQVQLALRRLGYYSGSIDGSFGTNTQNAVEAYQVASGEPVTGTLTLGVLSRLGVALR
jgi:hypothetical protein